MDQISKINTLIRLIFALLLFSGCSGGDSGSSGSSSTPPVPYCTEVTSYSSPITITGNAQYEYRANGNGAISGPNPIRFAEVRVTNAAGTIIQCGETNSSGQFSLSLPADGSAATIEVTSRADNSNVAAYVLQNPTTNTYHSLSTGVTLDGSKSVGSLTAPANGTLEGGAFNILDKILDANIFLRAQTANCSASFSNCTPFTIAPLVTAYWAAGVDPGTYFNIPSLSFYIPGENDLYILGGVNGDIDNSDTDHFDDTIIIHEYGHFIEDNFSITNSPGGAHSGNTILDPRLAWGEGWANYFQAAVTGNSVYRDTFGTIEGTTGVFFNEDLESGTTDTATTLGEGNFREFSITRALLDYTDTNNEGVSTDQLTTSFAEFWTLFAGSNGFPNSGFNFRSIGLFYTLQNALSGKSDWSEIQGAENQLATVVDYGNTFTLGGSCSTISIQAQNISGIQTEDGTPSNSNQFASNDFYSYTHPGGSFTMSLSYTTGSSASPADLDIYLYQNDYTFGSSSSVLGFSDDTIQVGETSDTETFTISDLAAGTYMINVNVNTSTRLGAPSTYSFSINSQNACPD
ncbi:MAG: hypothetical protein AAF203_00695 [Pseudomonadota bacterium]